MSTRLRNRRAIEEKLGTFIEAVAVPEDLVAGIMDAEVRAPQHARTSPSTLPGGATLLCRLGTQRARVLAYCCAVVGTQRARVATRATLHGSPVAPARPLQVNEEFLEHLLALDRKIKFLAADDTARGSQARRDAEVVLEKLRIKAVTKVGRGGCRLKGGPHAVDHACVAQQHATRVRCRTTLHADAPCPLRSAPSQPSPPPTSPAPSCASSCCPSCTSCASPRPTSP